MADLLPKYRIPEAKVKPLANAIRASESPDEDEDGNPIAVTDEETIDRFVMTTLQAIDHRYRRRQANPAVDEALVAKEP